MRIALKLMINSSGCTLTFIESFTDWRCLAEAELGPSDNQRVTECGNLESTHNERDAVTETEVYC